MLIVWRIKSARFRTDAQQQHANRGVFRMLLDNVVQNIYQLLAQQRRQARYGMIVLTNITERGRNSSTVKSSLVPLSSVRGSMTEIVIPAAVIVLATDA